jgi:peptidoglycan hydrolase-like protein with peptidoglycan-binding domain
MPEFDTHDLDSLAGAMYFIVGRGTEGGPSPYHLSIAGITVRSAEPEWGELEHLVGNSGYSLGSIQVDLGQRGTWPLGATEPKPLQHGQMTYVDALIAEVAQYAEKHHLKFTSDRSKLRADLLTHGNGERHRSKLVYIDTDTRDAFNTWASSKNGQKWIHRNIDYPQIRNATRSALGILDTDGRNIAEDHRLEAVALLVKTINQMPSKLTQLRQVLRDGGDYGDLAAEASRMSHESKNYDGPKAATLARRYLDSYGDMVKAAALDRVHAQVASVDFDPYTAAANPDFQEALGVLGQVPRVHVLRQGARGGEVASIQADLAQMGITDDRGRVLRPDGAFGPSTREAVESFQRAHGLPADGRVGAKTLHALQEAVRPREASLADRSHPGFALFCQALEGVHLIDAKCGRTPDAWSDNLAGSLATAAHAQGLVRIDQVVLGENATRAFAVQEDPGSPFKRVAFVDVLPAIGKPLAQSSAEFRVMEPGMPRQAHEAASLQASAQPVLSDMQR